MLRPKGTRPTRWLATLALSLAPVTAFAQTNEPLPQLPPASDQTPTTQPAPPTASPTTSAPTDAQPSVEIAPEQSPPPPIVVMNPPPNQYQPANPGAADESPPKHAPKFSLYTGLNLGVIGYGGSFFTSSNGQPETTKNDVGAGLSFELLVGARLGKRYIPYISWEHGFLAAGRRFDGTSTRASSDYIGIGFRLLSWDVDSVSFLSDLGIGFRSVTLQNDNENFKMTSLEIGRLGLGAEIRLSTLFTLSPVARLSFGQMTDSTGGISYGPGQGDGQTGVSFAGGQVNYSPREYVVLGLGCGGQFDFFGK